MVGTGRGGARMRPQVGRRSLGTTRGAAILAAAAAASAPREITPEEVRRREAARRYALGIIGDQAEAREKPDESEEKSEEKEEEVPVV